MQLSAADKIRIIIRKREMTLADLSDKTKQTRQNLSNKMTLDNFRVKELENIANQLNCELEINFVMKDTQEKI